MSKKNHPLAAKRGRPRDASRLTRIVDSAKLLFSEQGFERTTIDAIAEASGVSKMTVYSYFTSKEALFGATVLHKVREEFSLQKNSPLNPDDPKASLMVIGTQFLSLIRRDDVLGAHRALFSSAGTHPELCLAFYNSAPLLVVNEVAEFLDLCHKHGTMIMKDSKIAADQFLSLFLGLSHIRCMLGLSKPDKKQDKELLQQNVEIMIKVYGNEMAKDI